MGNRVSRKGDPPDSADSTPTPEMLPYGRLTMTWPS
jgi:hypothetical protein